MKVRAAACVAAVALLAGCGSDKDEITKVGRTYFNALADGDGPKACAQLTDKARAGFAHSLGAPSYGLTCDEFVEQKLYLFVGRDGKDAYRGVKLSPVETDGDKATAGATHFRREDGKWRVEPAFGAP